MPRPVPDAAAILYGDDGPLLMVRGCRLADVLDIAHGEAAGEGFVVTDPASVKLRWIRAIPCRAGGHEIDSAEGYCEGNSTCHYVDGRPGAGAFRGAFIDLTYEDDLFGDDPRRVRYLTEVAEMAAPAAARKDGT